MNVAKWVRVVTKGSAATADLLGTVESEDLLVIEEFKAILDRRVHKESAGLPVHKESVGRLVLKAYRDWWGRQVLQGQAVRFRYSFTE